MIINDFEEIIVKFRGLCLKEYPHIFINIDKEYDPTELKGKDIYPEAIEEITLPFESLYNVVKTPRMLKTILRRVWHSWKNLHGEAHIDELIIATTLKMAVPEAYSFLILNLDNNFYSRFIDNKSSNQDDNPLNLLEQKILKISEKTSINKESLNDLFSYLLGFYNLEKYNYNHKKPACSFQKIQGPFADNLSPYWQRINSEQVLNSEIKDQDILNQIKFSSKKKEPILYKDKLKHLSFITSNVLTKKEMFYLLDQCIEDIYTRYDKKSSLYPNRPGYETLNIRDILNSINFKLFQSCFEHFIGSQNKIEPFKAFLLEQINKSFSISLLMSIELFTIPTHLQIEYFNTSTQSWREDYYSFFINKYKNNPEKLSKIIDYTNLNLTINFLSEVSSLSEKMIDEVFKIFIDSCKTHPLIILPQIMVLISFSLKINDHNYILKKYKDKLAPLILKHSPDLNNAPNHKNAMKQAKDWADSVIQSSKNQK